MKWPVVIPGFGTIHVDTPEIQDRYKTLIDNLTKGPQPSDPSGHTNMDSVFRDNPDYPLQNAKFNSVGMPAVNIESFTNAEWDAKYANKVAAGKIVNTANKTVDKFSSSFNKDKFYKSLGPSGGMNPPPLPCGTGCDILLINGNKVTIWDYTANTPHMTMVLNDAMEAIAQDGTGKWFVGHQTGGINGGFSEYQIDNTTCDSVFVRRSLWPADTSPWFGAGYVQIADGLEGMCSKDANDIIIGGGSQINHWVAELDVSGPIVGITNLFQMGTNNPPPGYVNAKLLGGVIYLPALDQLVTTEEWTDQSGGTAIKSFHLVVRTRLTGAIICHTEFVWNSNYVWGLFCWDYQIRGIKYDPAALEWGIFEITYDETIPAISYNPGMAWSGGLYSGGGGATSPGCCGTGVVATPTLFGGCCTDSNGNPPNSTWPSSFACTNATANCGGNNCDGSTVTCLECLTGCGGITITGDAEIIDFNGNVVAQQLGWTWIGVNANVPMWLPWDNLCTGNYTVKYYNMMSAGQALNDINISCVVLGDHPWSCPAQPQCCLPSWNCDNCNCIDPGDGTGTYASLAACQAACCNVTEPQIEEIDCTDFDVCIPCDETIKY